MTNKATDRGRDKPSASHAEPRVSAFAERDEPPPNVIIAWLIALIYKIIVFIFRRTGWRTVGSVPEPRRFIIIAAPHTSNWDFLYYIGLTHSIGIRPHFMAKQSLFWGPIGLFLRALGGIPIDRSQSQNYVQAMVDEFAHRKEFILTIATEGTRRKPTQWRSGFYQIALAAKVPLVIGLMDYGRKTGGLVSPPIWPSGDFRSDMAKVFEVYKDCTPKHPHRAVQSLDDICGALPTSETAETASDEQKTTS